MYCLFFRISWGVGVLNSAIFNSFHNRAEFWHDFEGPLELRVGGALKPPPEPRYATVDVTGNEIVTLTSKATLSL